MSVSNLTIGSGIELGKGITIGSGTPSSPPPPSGGTYTVPFPDGMGILGEYIYINYSANANVAALEALNTAIIGWTVTASDNNTLTGIITAIDPVGHYGFKVVPGIGYAVGRNFIIHS